MSFVLVAAILVCLFFAGSVERVLKPLAALFDFTLPSYWRLLLLPNLRLKLSGEKREGVSTLLPPAEMCKDFLPPMQGQRILHQHRFSLDR